MPELIQQIAYGAYAIVRESAFWIVISLLAAGLIQEFLSIDTVKRVMHSRGRASLAGALGLGALLPTCSCGVIPLAVSFYLRRVRLAAVMTFAAATPVINPAAVVLSYALLGPELTLAYVAFGLLAPVAIGLLTERWGDAELNTVAQELESCCHSSCGEPTSPASAPPWRTRLLNALKWGFTGLGPTLGLYIGSGALLAGLVTALVPPDWVNTYLGESAPFVSLLLVALFGASIYVCAVAHIPLVAALLATGAAPGVAVVFLVTGAASNLPEFVALQRVMGLRTVAIYVTGLIAASLLAGWLVNLWLLPGYLPVLGGADNLAWIDWGNRLTPVIPGAVVTVSTVVVLGLITWGFVRWVARLTTRVPGRNALQDQ